MLDAGVGSSLDGVVALVRREVGRVDVASLDVAAAARVVEQLEFPRFSGHLV